MVNCVSENTVVVVMSNKKKKVSSDGKFVGVTTDKHVKGKQEYMLHI